MPKAPLVVEVRAEAVLMLIDSYRRAARTEYGINTFAEVVTAAEARLVPSARQLGEAAKRFKERGIPPLAWAVFSMRAWSVFRKHQREGNKLRKMRGGAPRCPGLAWTYSLKRLDDTNRTEWFAWEQNTIGTTRSQVMPAHTELLSRYGKLRAALLAHTDLPTVDQVEEAMRTHLTVRYYERLKAEAEEEALALEARWRKRQREGEVFL